YYYHYIFVLPDIEFGGWRGHRVKCTFLHPRRFQCSCCTCRWPLTQVLIFFHMHLDRSQRQGQVKMRVCGQKCGKCHGAKFETPMFSQENIGRILDNLVPSQTTCCEACALGICYLSAYRFVIPASLAAASQLGQLAWIWPEELIYPWITCRLPWEWS
uniref:3CxxC-type domain-containing protein n=1 Tax=Gopherus evgoodei TaxID=1825980 RepID=A0A8C4YDD0_9SAUR